MTHPCPPIVLFCDFGLPYTGQMKARLAQGAPEHPVIDLFHDVPAHNVQAGSVLLAAHATDFPEGSVFVCVVDPGVGSDERKPGVVHAGGRYFVGPLNGLFEHTLRRWSDGAAWEITWRPQVLSNSFHGRDLFAPMAAAVATAGADDGLAPLALESVRHPDFPDDVAEVIYTDGFGNLMTGLRAQSLAPDQGIEVAGRKLPRSTTFAHVPTGTLFCYENAVGLMEIAANRGNAAKILEIGPGAPIKIITRL